jgi:uncharacterized membrane protein
MAKAKKSKKATTSKQSPLTVGGAISFGWNAMKDNFFLFLQIMITIIAVQIFQILGDGIPKVGLFFVLVAIITAIIIQMGGIVITLNIVDGKKTGYQDLLSQARFFFEYLIGSVLYALIILGGLILLIVPGIIWAVKFQFYRFYIIDKKMGPIEALKASGKATMGHKWKLFKLDLALIGIIIVGFLALIVGLLAAVPTVWVAMAYAYRRLQK